MKRPLFNFCLFVILVFSVLTIVGFFSKERNRSLLPPDNSVVTLTGTICKTDSEKIYINRIMYVYSEGQSQAPPPDNVSSYKLPSYKLPSSFIFTFPVNECNSSVSIGNTVKIIGKFKSYSHASNPGEFDAFDYYSSQNIYGSLSKLKLTVISKHINPVRHYLNILKNKGIRSLNNSYSEVDASIMGDMLLGDKSGLDPGIKDLYQRVGISHILSISSLHISIIGLGLYMLLRKLRCPVKVSAAVSALVLILFGIMTGMSISAIRAIGIYVIGVLAQLLGRTTDKLTSLSLVATILIIINPSELTSCGFLLSFGSVFGICCLYPALKELITKSLSLPVRYHPDTRLYRLKKSGFKLLCRIGDSLLTGLSLTLTTLPIQLYYFYEIPIYSSLLNLLVIPLMSVLMICGYLSMLFPFLYLPAKICSLILSFYKTSATFFESLPFSEWNPGRPSTAFIILYYLLWLLVVLYPSCKKYLLNFFKRKRIFICITSVIFIFLIISANHCRLPRNSVLFMDVGQGDCILVYTDSRDVLLFDGGSSSRSKVGQYVIKSTLKYYGLSHITAIYVSHADNDHVNGINELLEHQKEWNLRIDTLYVTDFVYDEYRQLPITRCISSGYEQLYGSVHLTCLHPASNYTFEDTNSASMCILLEFTNSHLPVAEQNNTSRLPTDISHLSSSYIVPTTLLLCGDVCNSGEELLTDAILPYSPITLLKVSHHGSKYSTGEHFLSVARPSLAFISAGVNNSYGHPAPETLERLTAQGCTYYSTIDSGAITVNVKRNSLVLSQYSHH